MNGRIAFTRCDSTSCNDGDLWSIAADGTAAVQLTSGTANYDEAPTYSADGRRIVFERCDEAFSVGCAVVVANADGSAPQALTDGHTFDYEPSFSPNGALVVFSRSTSGGDTIETMPAGGGAVNPLTSGTAYESTPRFSPDGSKIVFERFIPATTDSIWVMDSSGGNQTQITHQDVHHADRSPDWSPDGTKIVFNRYDGSNYRVWMVDADGANAHMVTDPGAGYSDEQPVFSPDGTQIAFVRYPPSGGTSAIWVMNVDGTGAHVVTSAADREYGPSWQPTAPVFTGPPTITGSAVIGHVLSATAATVVGGGSAEFLWLRCDAAGTGCVGLGGPASPTYPLSSADLGRTIRVTETQANPAGSSSATSAPTAVVAPNPARCSNIFVGTAAADVFPGTAGGDRLVGAGGNDVLSGGAGDDCIEGGPGKDRISGGSGSDRLFGGPGNDRITGGPGKDTISAGSGNDKVDVADGARDTVSCGKGRDTVRADRRDKLHGCERVTRVGRKKRR